MESLVFLLVVSLALYFVPVIVATVRNHRQRLAIIMLNIFGGWTCVGWVVALVWACTQDIQQGPRPLSALERWEGKGLPPRESAAPRSTGPDLVGPTVFALVLCAVLIGGFVAYSLPA